MVGQQTNSLFYIIELLTAVGYLVNMTTIETITILLLVQEKIKRYN